MQVHLVDGTYELFRHFYGAPARRAPDGREVGATCSLMRSLVGLLRAPGTTHVACAFDTVIESFRNELFAGYKTGAGIEPDLLAQFPLAERAVRALGVVVWSMVEFEADDALATAAARFAPEVDQVVLLSPDKDLAQCVRGSHVVTHDRIRRVTYDEAGVRAKFGVAPASIPDLLALVGDTADGIPGIPGWGAKSAAAILSAYGHLDAIPEDPAQWPSGIRGRERLAAALAARRDDALLYRTLATLRVDAPLPERLADLAWTGVPRAAFTECCERLGLGAALAAAPTQWR